MTVYILPCGVSMLDGLSLPRGRPGSSADAVDLLSEALPWAKQARKSDDTIVVKRYQKDLETAIDDARLGKWATEVAAETNSIRSRTTSFDTVLSDGNTVVLLASDTDSGVAAAMTVAARVAADTDGTCDYGRIRYITTPLPQVLGPGSHAGWHHKFATGTVTVVRIRGLDPRTRGSLDTAAEGLGQALRAAYDSADGEPVEIHLTGGLKATLLHLLLMAEVLHSLRGEVDVSAWYLYDDVKEKSDERGPEAVRIGLRRFEPTYLFRMHRELCNVRDGKPNKGRTFEGLAWTGNDREAKLTDFGNAFLAVLGEEIDPPHDDEGYQR